MKKFVSIIVVFHNLQEITLQCLESIYQHSNLPFELILVDNGSKNDISDKLKKLKNLRFIRNKRNEGYIVAINQGLRKARGDAYLLLNNDTIATPNWLENMVTCLFSAEEIGIVGPVTNRIGNSKQKIKTPSFQSYHDIISFGRDFNKSNPRKWFPFDHSLAGFCMLIKSIVVERIGYFDEDFALGLCEDYDFVRRAKEAGFEVMCAGDTFLFHYYNMTFNALKIDRPSLLEKNKKKYRQKWT